MTVSAVRVAFPTAMSSEYLQTDVLINTGVMEASVITTIKKHSLHLLKSQNAFKAHHIHVAHHSCDVFASVAFSHNTLEKRKRRNKPTHLSDVSSERDASVDLTVMERPTSSRTLGDRGFGGTLDTAGKQIGRYRPTAAVRIDCALCGRPRSALT